MEIEYKLSGLSTDELLQITMNVTNFTLGSAVIIESGFDNDWLLEYHEIAVSVLTLNGMF